jgi:tRNA threonylcarbamoyladenosine biosynthesis protein TsaB
MLLLAIDTSGKLGSIALAKVGEPFEKDFELIDTVPLAGGTFSAQLVPQTAGLLSSQGFTKRDICAFAVVAGPGSFTGLRVGLAAVKALAEVLHKPIAAVSLLELCAFVSGVQARVMAALNAGRGDVYVGEYEVPAQLGGKSLECLLSQEEFLARAKGRTVVTPDSALADMAGAAGASVTTLPAITSADVARMGWRKLQAGQTVTPEQLEANYIRRTDAEMLAKSGS